ncbi:hypothetical protein C943_04154 [Mariniradius saccharolyticus AK6]|uniref:AAA domain-containing protein n=1 Tax=Mariniradius saccharolyticus AK6 TaxID=1239962 RepID=M7X8W7_9BACT|nr:DUF3696 domain-containing protein [Mariniradius saccharolyticus]EMS33835.1 hypothetical protein C943_04154 [Mariniradius saccharolyticus AK6]
MRYFHHLGLDNFRLFSKLTTFSLAPITIITGTNNSGKSSLIKSLQLFNNSVQETKGITKLSFANGRHNLGTFRNVLNKNRGNQNQLTFEFDFHLPQIDQRAFLSLTYEAINKSSESGTLVSYRVFLESGETILKCVLKGYDEHRNSYYFNMEKVFQLLLEKFDDKYLAETRTLIADLEDWGSDESLIYQRGGAENLNFNNYSIFKLFKYKHTFGSIYPDDSLFFHPDMFDGESFYLKGIEDPELKKKIEEKIVSSFQDGVSVEFDEGTGDYIFSTLGWALGYWKTSIEMGFPKSAIVNGWSALMEYILTKYIPHLHKAIVDFDNRFHSINSLSSLRANTSRMYSNASDIVEINSLILEFSQLNIPDGDQILEFIKEQLILFDIGDDIDIKRHQGVASEISIVKNGEKTLLADLGYGFSQFLPLIIKVAIIAYNKRYHVDGTVNYYTYPPSMLLLEEPESNLHPSNQSKLAEFVFAAAAKFNIQFLIETHSEYMIRNFQFMVASKRLGTEDVTIYYFNKPDTAEYESSPFRKIDILPGGRLSGEFGTGFFDETPRLLSELFNSNFN